MILREKQTLEGFYASSETQSALSKQGSPDGVTQGRKFSVKDFHYSLHYIAGTKHLLLEQALLPSSPGQALLLLPM